MVDKENLGDNNMSSEQVERFHRRNSFHGLSHTVFLNSALPEAKKYSERKHDYIAIVIPPHIHKGKKKTNSYPSVSGFRFLSQMLPKQCSSSE